MALFKEGEKSKCICEWCDKKVQTTFRYRDYVVEGKPTIPHILQGVCDECGRAISVPGDEMAKAFEMDKIRKFCEKCPCYEYRPEGRMLRPNFSTQSCIVNCGEWTLARDFAKPKIDEYLDKRNKTELPNGKFREEVSLNPECPIVAFLKNNTEEVK